MILRINILMQKTFQFNNSILYNIPIRLLYIYIYIHLVHIYYNQNGLEKRNNLKPRLKN